MYAKSNPKYRLAIGLELGDSNMYLYYSGIVIFIYPITYSISQ